MSSVASSLKADGVEQQLLVSTAAPASRAHAAAPAPLPQDEASISSAGRLRGTAMVVRDVAETMAQSAVWQAQQVQSSAPDQVQASSEAAPLGRHDVRVDALAEAQVTATATFSSLSTVIGIGTLNIEMGKWSNSSSTFATNPNWPKANVTMGPQDNTLERVRDRINAAGVGVIASVVSDATGSRLVLSATSTGADNGFRIQAEPGSTAQLMAQANQIAKFAYSPDQDSAGQGMQLLQSAQDAQVSVDGRPLSSDANVLDDQVTGLRLNLKTTTSGASRLDVQSNDEGIKRRLQSLAASMQDLQQQVQQPSTSGDTVSRQAQQDARQEAQQALDTVKANLTGPDAPSWQSIGLSWDEQRGVQQQDVSWTPELRKTGQQLFATLASQLPTRDIPPRAAEQAASPWGAATSTNPSAVAVQRNRQRLLDQYTLPAPASAEQLRQDLPVS
jgi:flagellar hook-associated protein 2